MIVRASSTNDDPEDRKKELINRLAMTCIDVGTRVGAMFGLDPPESLCATLYMVCGRKLASFDETRGSLTSWCFGYARRIASRERQRLLRDRHGELPISISGDAPDPSELLYADSPLVMKDDSDQSIELLIEERRPTWRQERAEVWVHARELDPRQAAPDLRRVALYDTFIGAEIPRLVVPWEVYCRGIPRKEIARRRGVKSSAVDKEVSRFHITVRGHFATRAIEHGRIHAFG